MPHRSPVIAWEAYRAEFPTCERTTYLNTCSLGALSRRSRAAVQTFLDLWEEHGASAWYATWLSEVAALRAGFERLVNAPAGSVAIHHSISSALSVVASCYPYSGRNRIITTALDFPTIPYQWLVKQGVEVVTLPSPDGIGVPLESWAAAIDERTALVATSHVFFTSGYIQPVAELARLAHASGAHIVVDGYQAAGQLPVDVAALDVDYYLSGGLKWLLGGPGVVELYVKPELVADLVARANDAGLRLKLPQKLEQHAGIVMFPAEDPAGVVRALKAERIVVDYRPGHVRVSPYFYSTFDEHALLIEQMRKLIHGGGHL